MKTIIKNGVLLGEHGEQKADLLLEGGVIRQIGEDLMEEGAKIIDAKGKYVMPGGVDQHVHFSFEFNGTKVRGFESSAAAAMGGTTTVIEFVNQKKDHGLLESIETYEKEQAQGIAAVDYSFHCVLTDPRPEVFEEIPRLAEEGYPTMKLFMAYKGMFFHSDDEAILKALEKAREAGITLMVHAENADAIDILQRKLIAEGHTEPYYHAVSRPPLVEAEATRRAIYLAQLADAPIYIVHVTCREALEEIRRARMDGALSLIHILVDKDLEPTKGAGPARAGELLKIGKDAAGLVGERGQLAHSQAAENNGNGGQSKDKSAQSHAAPGGHQHIVAFEKDARADADADDHGNGREKAISLVVLFHNRSPCFYRMCTL